MNSLAPLMRLIDVFASATGLPDSTISYRVFGDTKKVAALREGADITTGRLDGAFGWFSGHWPENATWPADVKRPSNQPPDLPPNRPRSPKGVADAGSAVLGGELIKTTRGAA